jgi:hypothetical protein
MIWLLLIVVAAVVLYKFRVPIIAKLTGQEPSRIERRLNQRKR